jgi:hypothetical protein
VSSTSVFTAKMSSVHPVTLVRVAYSPEVHGCNKRSSATSSEARVEGYESRVVQGCSGAVVQRRSGAERQQYVLV